MTPRLKWRVAIVAFFFVDLVLPLFPLGSLLALIGVFYTPFLRWLGRGLLTGAGETLAPEKK